jgi:hypothetical protein
MRGFAFCISSNLVAGGQFPHFEVRSEAEPRETRNVPATPPLRPEIALKYPLGILGPIAYMLAMVTRPLLRFAGAIR